MLFKPAEFLDNAARYMGLRFALAVSTAMIFFGA